MKRPRLNLLLALLIVLAALPPARADASRTFFAMDTVMTVTAPGADEKLLAACEDEVRRLEALFSVTAETSEIARLNETGEATLSDETAQVLRFALEEAELTGGALDVTLYPVVRAWGFTTGDYRVPDDAEIAAQLARVGWTQVGLDGNVARVPEGVMVDLGAVAKGYASDRLAALLRAHGVGSALIDLGGNICCVGAKRDGSAWRIGVQDPANAEKLLGTITVDSGTAIATSGDYQRYYEVNGIRYHHILDPRTGWPARQAHAVTVVTRSATLSDYYSTMLFVMPREKALEFAEATPDLDIIYEALDGTVSVSSGLKDRFTPSSQGASS